MSARDFFRKKASGPGIRNRNWHYAIAPILAISSFVLYVSLQTGSLSGLFNPSVLSLSLSDIVKEGTVFCLLAIGASAVIATSQIDLSSIGVATLAGVVFSVIMSYFENQHIGSIIVGSIAGMTVGVISGYFIYWCFKRFRSPLLILTWAIGSLYVILSIFISRFATSEVISGDDGVGIRSSLEADFWHFLSFGFFMLLFFCYIFAAFLPMSNLATKIKAIGANETSAQYLGVNKDSVFKSAFIFNGLISALAGILHCIIIGTASTTDLSGKELVPIAIAVLGGTGLAGGYLSVSSVICAAIFWITLKLSGPQLSDAIPLLGKSAEAGQITFFFVFVVISLVFGRTLMPPVPKIYAKVSN